MGLYGFGFYDCGEMLIQVFGFEWMLGDEKCHKILRLLNYLIFFTTIRYACDSCHIKCTDYKWIPNFVYITNF